MAKTGYCQKVPWNDTPPPPQKKNPPKKTQGMYPHDWNSWYMGINLFPHIQLRNHIICILFVQIETNGYYVLLEVFLWPNLNCQG